MAFPTVAGTRFAKETSNTTTHNVLPPSHSANDILLAFIVLDDQPTISGMASGWARLKRNWPGSGAVLEIWWKRSVGGSENDFTFTSSTAQYGCCRCFAITGAHTTTDPEVDGDDMWGSDDSPDPGGLNPVNWGTEDTLWIAVEGNDAGAVNVSAFPTDYSDNQYGDPCGNNNHGVNLGSCSRELNAALGNPGAFTIDAAQEWAAQVVGIRPAPASTTYFRTLNASSPGIGSLSYALVTGITMNATAGAVATLAKAKTLYRALSASSPGAASLDTVKTLFRTIAASSPGVAGLTREKTLFRSLVASSPVVATLGKTKTLFRSLATVATGIAGLAKLVILAVEFPSRVGSARVIRQPRGSVGATRTPRGSARVKRAPSGSSPLTE